MKGDLSEILQEKIRLAQVAAGELEVMKHLEQSGLSLKKAVSYLN